jgi:hypothetical protein
MTNERRRGTFYPFVQEAPSRCREHPFDPNRSLTYSSNEGSPIAAVWRMHVREAGFCSASRLTLRRRSWNSNREILMAEQLTPVLTLPPKTSVKIERRAWLRFPSDRDIICKPPIRLPHGEPEVSWLGNVRDVSSAGIGLDMSRRFEPGAELIIELSSKAGETLRLPVCVVHATPQEQGRWIIGCEFLFPLSEEQLRTFLAEDSGSLLSKRRWFRSKRRAVNDE